MRKRVVPIVLLLLSGCKGPALVVVHVGSVSQIDGIASFMGTATAGGKTVPIHFEPSGGAVSIPPEATFGIQLPASITGNISVDLTAQDATGSPLATGEGAGTISSGSRSDLSLMLGASSSDLDLSMSGPDLGMSALAITPPSFAFGSAARGSTGTTKAFTVTNSGVAPAGPLTTASLTGAAASSFAVVGDGCNAMTIEPGASCTVTVQFSPKVAGIASADVQVGGAVAALSGYAVGSWHSETLALDISGSGGAEVLSSVWGSGPNDVYAVGSTSSSTGVVLHRDSTGVWQAQTPVGAQKLAGVWGSSATDVFAVGGNLGGGHASVLHSNGNGAFAETFMFSQSAANWVFGFATTNVYLAWSSGTAGPPHSGVWHSTDGVTFSAQPGVGGAGVPPDSMAAVWGSGPADLYAVAAGVYHSVGDGGWFQQNATANLTSVRGSSSTDVYAVGMAGVVLHSKGDGTWTPQTALGGDYYGVWQSGPNDIWIVGSNGTAARSTGDGAWSQPASTSTFVTLRAVWGSSSGDIYAVGDGGVVVHYY